MSKTLDRTLTYRFILFISSLFIIFSFVLIWSYKHSYFTFLEDMLQNITGHIEQEIRHSHYDIKNKYIVDTSYAFFIVDIYSDKEQTHLPAKDINRSFDEKHQDGFHIVHTTKDGSTKYYAHYGKHFEIYHNNYYIHTAMHIENYLTAENFFLLKILLFLLFVYVLALYWGVRYIKRLTAPLHSIIGDMSKISNTSHNIQLNSHYPYEEYNKLTHKINMILERLHSELMKTKRFNAKVSHELRTPLTIIRGEIEVTLLKDRNKDEYKALLKSTLEEVDTLQAITDNMLLLTKLDFKTIQVKKLQVRVDKLIQEVVSSSLIQAEAKSIKIATSLESLMYPMEEVLIKQSLKNLINNAIKYSPEDTTIQVSLQKTGRQMIIEVADEGFGIHEHDIKSLFKPHFRSSNILEEISGEGLGLTIVHHAMELHQAKITVDSILGKGTKFQLIFEY